MTLFTEDPSTIYIAGCFALVVLLVFVLKTGRGVVLLAMAGVAMFMLVAALIDKLVVTDREQVENVIYQAAETAEQNRLNDVMAFISPSAPDVQSNARRWIRQIKLENVSITAMEVTVDRTQQPPTAAVVFKVFARGQVANNPGTYFGRISADLRLEGDRWLVTNYDHDP